MPFAVFRRHQRKLLAIFAILAMFAFVLGNSLPRLFDSPGGPGGDPLVVSLYGKSVHRGDLSKMAGQRQRANLFMAQLGFADRPFFGDLTTRAIVDALILQHEADALGMPAGPEVGRDLLKQATGGFMTREMFEEALNRSGTQVSGEQILTDIANQVRLNMARRLLGNPVVTPLDVFQTFRDQTRRVSVRAVGFPIENYLGKVAEPTPAQVQSYYDKYKDVLPEPNRDTPGFKVPRRVQVEILSIEGADLARQLKEKLTESELQTYYENRKAEFAKPSELPVDLFADDPQATKTPAIVQPFADVRPNLAISLADEKAQTEIVNRFTKIKDEVMIPFADKYHDALDEMTEAKKSGETPAVQLPRSEGLGSVAAREGLKYEKSPVLTRERAEHYGTIANAEVGLTRLSGGRKFAAEFFDTRSSLFEPVELTDDEGRRYLARKVEDQAPRVPPLKEIQAEVILAWKKEQARPLAEKAARDFAQQVRSQGGTIKSEVAAGRPVITTEPVTKWQRGFPLPGQLYQSAPPTLTEIDQIPNAGDALRDAYFSLEPGDVAVAPNQAKTFYYVLTANHPQSAPLAVLFAPNGEYVRYQREALTSALKRRDDERMSQLRAQAGLDPDWVPKDEANREATADRSS